MYIKRYIFRFYLYHNDDGSINIEATKEFYSEIKDKVFTIYPSFSKKELDSIFPTIAYYCMYDISKSIFYDELSLFDKDLMRVYLRDGWNIELQYDHNFKFNILQIFTTWRNYSWLDRQMKAECAMRDNKHNYIARLKGHNKGVNMLYMTEILHGDCIIHPNTNLIPYDMGFWGYFGLYNTLIPPLPTTLFWTLKVHKVNGIKPLYLKGEDIPSLVSIKDGKREHIEMSDEEGIYYTHFRDYSGSFKVKGNLRISQSLNLKEKAPIDIMIFFDKESALAMDTGNFLLKSPYKDDIYNHKIVREILGEERFRRLMSKRFHYETIAIEAQIGNIDGLYTIKNPICALIADYNFSFFNDEDAYEWQLTRTTPLEFGGFPMANILSFKVVNTFFELVEYNDIFQGEYYIDTFLEDIPKVDSNATKSNFAIPILKGLFATTTTNENDFFVNLRDKPDSKDSKILMQLYSQGFRTNNKEIQYDFYARAGESDEFYGWYNTQLKLQKAYFLKYKDSMIHPFYFDRESYIDNRTEANAKDYIIFIQDIMEKDWAKVWVLRYDKYIDEYKKGDDINDKSYTDTFLESPSKMIIKEGYIHASGLEPYRVFPIRR
ncbi:hypothetical protein CQA53_10425 [Helicobacter didelphidarum]|uniref:Uncharacterized protein n=1 Tax=Helicobacter didelphidarum TaxID=2040648 RepID=A0A3D8I824_9HELI|nr:hypothetical protein [Helicobacter didelphidarum]RDU61257.1 hypothetical protein CQA53_10425 [Helicobacter didelphidarum]